jgi:type IV secretory pathway TraG/TraD family ATPase VirD4
MQLVLALQSLAQAQRRWGDRGAGTLLDNMPAEILLGGLTDTAALKRYAVLVGEVELARASTSYDSPTGRATTASEQWTDRPVMRADEARQLPDGHGLLIYRNLAAVMLRLTPWYQRPDGQALDAERARTERARVAPEPVDATPAGAP